MEKTQLLDARIEYNESNRLELENDIKEFEARYLLKNPAGHTPTNLLQYAMLLSKGSPARRKEAVGLLKRLLREQDPLGGGEDLTSAILYNLSLVLYGLGEYDESRGFCEDLVGIAPDNRQFTDMHEAVVFRHKEKECQQKEKKAKDLQNVGIAASVGVATLFAIGAIASIALRSGKRK